MLDNGLKDISTEDLIKELIQRRGVDHTKMAKGLAGQASITHRGISAATILVVNHLEDEKDGKGGQR